MKHRIIIALIVGVVAVMGAGAWYASSQNIFSTPKNGAVLDYDLGNNDGSSKVYDTSGNGDDLTVDESQNVTLTDSYAELSTVSTNKTLSTTTDAFATSEFTIAMEFIPNFDPFTEEERWYLSGSTDPGGSVAFNLFISGVGDTMGLNLTDSDGKLVTTRSSFSNWQSIWNDYSKNILIVRVKDGSNQFWLNGERIADTSGVWNTLDGTNVKVGTSESNTFITDGKWYYYKVWQRYITDAEVDSISGSDKTNSVKSAPKNDLVGHWNMDSNDYNGTTLLDNSGNGNDAVDNNMDTSDLVVGKIEQALDFNGTDENLLINNYSDFDFGTSTDFTLSAWIKTDTVYSDFGSIIDIHVGTPRWEMGVTNANKLYVHTNDSIIPAITVTTPNPSDGQWHLLTAVFDRDGDLSLYLDGNFASSEDISSIGDLPTSEPVGIGSNPDNTNNIADPIDDVRVYRRALSTQEISGLYSATKKQYVKSAPRNGLVGYWNMDTNDINGTTLYDKSGNSYDGTITDGGGSGFDSVAGKIREGRDFDGNDYVTMTSNTSTNIYPTDSVSVSLWFRADAFPSNYHWLVGANSDRFADDGYMLYWNSDEMKFGINAFSKNAGIAFPSSNAGNGVWYHLVGTYDKDAGSDQTKIYLNTQEGTPYTQSSIIDYDAAEFNIGRLGGSTSRYYFNGAIDDVRIYDKALSHEEVKQIYNSADFKF